jgi:hypothetical protein
MRYLVSPAFLLLWLALAWYGGAELLERSFENATVVGSGIFFSIWIYFYPGYDV